MKRLRKLLCICFVLLSTTFLQVHASSDVYVEDTSGYVSQEDIDTLNAYAKEVSDTYQFGVYARVIYDETGESYDNMDDYIENYYEKEDLGYGNTSNGVLLLITFSEEGGSYQVYIPHNSDQSMFTLDGMDAMDKSAFAYLKDHNYDQAINAYISRAQYLLSYYQQHGEAYEQDNSGIKYALTFSIPPIIALIVILTMKQKLKTKAIATTANSYIPQDGIHLTNQRDMYLYRSVTRTPIPKNDSSSGGGAHFSSSGGMHSGGGHF